MPEAATVRCVPREDNGKHARRLVYSNVCHLPGDNVPSVISSFVFLSIRPSPLVIPFLRPGARLKNRTTVCSFDCPFVSLAGCSLVPWFLCPFVCPSVRPSVLRTGPREIKLRFSYAPCRSSGCRRRGVLISRLRYLPCNVALHGRHATPPFSPL